MNKNFHNLFIDVKKLDEVFNDAIIVVDTNVLLMAYQWRDITFETVYDILNELAEQDRLKIPNQVIEEFANQRPRRIRDLSNDVHSKILSRLTSGSVKDATKHAELEGVIPSLVFFENTEKLLENEKKYNEALTALTSAQKQYKESLNNLLDDIKEYIDNDPILDKYRKIFEISVLDEPKYDDQELKDDLERRKKENVPPGYKDKGHMGDLKIWREILSLANNNVIFITRDNKNDWVYKDSSQRIISARRELVEEFYKVNNKTFKMLSPVEFVEKYSKTKGHNMRKEVKEDMEKSSLAYVRNFTLLNAEAHGLSPEEIKSGNNLVLRYQIDGLEKKINEYLSVAYDEKILLDDEYTSIMEELKLAEELKKENLSLAKEQYSEVLKKLQNVFSIVFD
ncbi:PIN-like domain-containing protein (plasmid) [Priestia megaterium]|uniref:PIN-like domain-containing protein n=1 Tax=Priestia megaterium TaxID=1404 RepID=UPI00389AC016